MIHSRIPRPKQADHKVLVDIKLQHVSPLTCQHVMWTEVHSSVFFSQRVPFSLYNPFSYQQLFTSVCKHVSCQFQGNAYIFLEHVMSCTDLSNENWYTFSAGVFPFKAFLLV
jgi:hypothetical protein